MDHTLILLTGSPLDDRGRLLHEDDPAAQLALSTARLEAEIAAAGHDPAHLTCLRVFTTDLAAITDVTDVLTERLAALGTQPVIDLVAVAALAVPGQLVALETVLESATTPHPTSQKELS